MGVGTESLCGVRGGRGGARGQLCGRPGERERERDGVRTGESSDGGLGEATAEVLGVTVEVGRFGWRPLMGGRGAHRVAITLEAPRVFFL